MKYDEIESSPMPDRVYFGIDSSQASLIYVFIKSIINNAVCVCECVIERGSTLYFTIIFVIGNRWF